MAEQAAQLLPQHQQLIDHSGISSAVADARGYRAVRTKAELKELGFSDAQCRVPALLIPIYNVRGELVLHQIRPDQPRVDKKGKPLKYETPRGAHMVLDVPPTARQHLGDPTRPLFITEGVRKADAAVSQGLCCIALLGVWNFRGTNEHGGKTLLADWEYIALEGRETFIVFDSDVMLKAPVYTALGRLKAMLDHRRANVRLIYLDSRADGAKVGLDDFLGAGQSTRDLVARATDVLRPRPTTLEQAFSYKATPTGFVWGKPTRDGPLDTTLSNFTAQITDDVVEDDGVETRRMFVIEARQGEQRSTVRVPAERFATMSWPAEALGARAILAPGQGVKDHVRVAVQLASQDLQERHVYAHLGWRSIGGQWCYLHAGGAITQHGAEPGLESMLPPALDRYVLPTPPARKNLKTALQASLRLLTVAPVEITLPCYAALWRALLGETDFSLHLSGPTGAGKSELAALIQQHYGPAMTARQLPASWTSTGNALERIAFAAKDAVLTVDDFCPTGSSADVQRMHREADRILRAQGNHAGRLRLRADSSLLNAKPPRGLILSTGEDIPRGQSLRSRLLVIEVSPEDVDWAVMSTCQKDAAAGYYAQTLAGFVHWLAGQYDTMREQLTPAAHELRAHLTDSLHKRTPDIVANLAIGFRYFLRFAVESRALAATEAEIFWETAWEALTTAAHAQAQHQAASEPAWRFLELLFAALASGRAHVASSTGAAPAEADSWGWRSEPGQIERRPQGERIGWLEGEDLYLSSDAALAVVQRLARDQGETLPVTPRVLHKRLKEGGYLASSGLESARETVLVRRSLEGTRRLVLHLHANVFTEAVSPRIGPAQPAQPDKKTSQSGNGQVLSAPWAGFFHQPAQQPAQQK